MKNFCQESNMQVGSICIDDSIKENDKALHTEMLKYISDNLDSGYCTVTRKDYVMIYGTSSLFEYYENHIRSDVPDRIYPRYSIDINVVQSKYIFSVRKLYNQYYCI